MAKLNLRLIQHDIKTSVATVKIDCTNDIFDAIYENIRQGIIRVFRKKSNLNNICLN